MARGLNVFVQIGARIGSNFNSSVRTVERRFDQLARHVKLRSAEMRATMRGLETSMSRFGTHVSMPAGFAAGAGMRFAYEWSKVGNELQAVTQMSMQARKEVEKVARSLPGNPAENLRGALDLARTGYDDPAVLSALLPTTIKLGRADSSVDVAEAADIMSNVMKGMQMPDDNFADTKASAERVANNIAFAAAKSSTDVRLMGESFKYAAPLAARLKMPIEHLSGYFMTMADAGIKGSESGVALRSGMVRLLKPTKAAMAVLAKYNMNLADYTGGQSLTGGSLARQLAASGFKANAGELDRILASDVTGQELTQRITEAVANGISDGAGAADMDKVAEAVNNALVGGADKMNFTKFLQDVMAKGWTTSDIVHFFDVRQGARLSTLTGGDMAKNIERVEAAMRAANGEGSFLDKMYLMQMQGAVGPWERMKQAFGNLAIAMAESGAMDTIAGAINTLANGVMWLSEASPGLLKFVTLLTLGAAAAAPLGWMLSGIAATGQVLVGVLRPLGSILAPLIGRLVPLRTAMVYARYGLLAAAGASLPLIAGLVAVGLAIAWIIAKWDGIKAFFQGIKQGFVEAVGPENMAGIQAFFNTMAALLTPLRAVFQALWEYGIKPVWEGLKKLFAPADVEAWGSAGRTLGSIIGGIVGAFVDLISKVGSAISKLKEFFSAGSGAGVPAGGFAPRGAPVPGRALGGSVSGGRMYEWHERGREFFVPGRSGTVIDAATVSALNRYRGGGGGGVTATFNIYDAHNPQAVAATVRGELNRLASQQSGYLSD